MTFDQVLVFHKIVQSGSFKQAAAELHKTQPAISLSIKKLEEEMEVDLFDRSGYRPELTDHGKAFYERSLKVLQGMTELEGLSQSFRKQQEPEISISVDGISPLPKLLHIFKNFGEKHPNTKLNLTFDILSEIERRVLEREAQIGVTHFISDKNALDVVPVTTVKMVPVMSKELFKERKVKNQKDLLEIDQIVIGDKNPRGASFGLLDEGRKWRINDNNFKRDIIFAGLGWGHLPDHSIVRELAEKKLVVLEFEDIHPRELVINLIRHKRHQLGVVANLLWEELKKNC
ncbi:LysR family transcriptional regulator [Peredibacter starrii]|uniref:LysR family transcriptional regulator n=2 Tax=Peredibacter starrii TaxID=28202 RepID=A0AAX4HVC0_9BACT|nr:LysR family transcriptional regulator [Peredibacter starrii]WPU67130.1 LysR family transcriptional regulator [Peredibacter starrii]